jgi:hypothetical protein
VLARPNVGKADIAALRSGCGARLSSLPRSGEDPEVFRFCFLKNQKIETSGFSALRAKNDKSVLGCDCAHYWLRPESKTESFLQHIRARPLKNESRDSERVDLMTRA